MYPRQKTARLLQVCLRTRTCKKENTRRASLSATIECQHHILHNGDLRLTSWASISCSTIHCCPPHHQRVGPDRRMAASHVRTLRTFAPLRHPELSFFESPGPCDAADAPPKLGDFNVGEPCSWARASAHLEEGAERAVAGFLTRFTALAGTGSSTAAVRIGDWEFSWIPLRDEEEKRQSWEVP